METQNLFLFSQKNIKILAVSAARLGDALFSTPVFRAIKLNFPTIGIDIVTNSELASQVILNNPSISRCIETPSLKTLTQMQNQYLFGLNVHPSDSATHIFNTLALPFIEFPKFKSQEHKAKILLDALTQLTGVDWKPSGGHYDLFPTVQDFQSIDALLSKNNLNNQTDLLIGLHLGCHSIAKKRFQLFGAKQHSKVWPIKHFIALSKEIIMRYPTAKIIITGSKNEESLAKKLMENCPRVFSFINQTTVNELAALMERLKIYICSDTGALHVAARSKVQLIALFQSDEINHTGPFPYNDKKHYVLHRPSISDIPVAEVLTTMDCCLIKKHI